MKDHKTIPNRETWIPIDKRGENFPPRKPETRSPLLWIERIGNELFLVNATGEILESVYAGTGGFQTCDDDVVHVASKSSYLYKNVKPNHAVKINEFDGLYDLDYVLQEVLEIKSKTLGHIKILTPSKKGGIGETILLWDTGECGKNVVIDDI